jgi:tetratricopeptide (TPR) repeat protein
MAPEVKRGGRADARSDQYSFALTVAEALGDRQPRRVRRVLARARAEDPGARFPSVDHLVRALERRSLALPALAAVVLAASAWLVWPRASDPGAACDADARAQLWGVYRADDVVALRVHIAALSRIHARDATFALDRLERYAGDWLAMAQSSCRATRVTGEQAAELFERRQACLGERLDDIAGVDLQLAKLDDAHADRAQQIADNLGDLDQCIDPRNTGGSAIAHALRTQLVDVHTQLEQGFFDRAEHALDAMLAQARAAHLPAVEGQLLISRSALLARMHRPGATEGFHAALAIAERINDPALRIDALNALLADAAVDLSRASEIELLAKMIERGLADLPGKQRRRRAIAQGNLANYYEDKQDFPAAERAAKAAYEAFRDEAGPVHPYTIGAHAAEARIQAHEGHYDAAIAITTDNVTTLQRTYGAEHPMLVQAELDLGVNLAFAQRLDEAGAAFQRALAIAEKLYGPDHPVVAAALRKVGFLELDRHPAVARDAFARAIAIAEKANRADNSALIPLLVGLGESQLLTGEPTTAVATLERCLELWGTSQTNLHLRPQAKYALAQALWESHGDRVRARRLGEEARAEYIANKGPWLPKADEVAKWLTTHR